MYQKITSLYQNLLKSLPPDPLPWSVLGFTFSLALLQLDMTVLPNLLYGMTVIMLVLYSARYKFSFSNILFFILIGALIGSATISYHNHYRISQTQLKRAIYNSEATGTITDIKDRGQKKYYYIENDAGQNIPHKVRLTFKDNANHRLWPDDVIRYKAHYYPLPKPLFEGDYDFSFFATSEGLNAIGNIKDIIHVTQPDKSFMRFIHHIRHNIETKFFAALPPEQAAIAVAMTTGNRTLITDETDMLWKDTGIYHLLSISGLHMTIIAGLIFVSIRSLLLVIPKIALKYNIKKIAAFCAIFAAYFYMLISGESVPAMRAFITVSVMLSAVLLDRQVISIRNAVIAFYIILLMNPAQLFHIGFCLSFAAVLGIIFAADIISSVRQHKYKTHYEPFSFSEKIMAFIGVNLCASYSGLPLSLYAFGKIVSVSFIANLVAVPLVSMVIMPVLILSIVLMCVNLEFLTLPIFEISLQIIEGWANILHEFDYNITHVKPPQPFHLILLYFGLYLGVILKNKGKFLCILPLFTAFILYGFYVPPDYIALNDKKSLAFLDDNNQLILLTHKQDHKPSSYLHDRISRFFGYPKDKDYYVEYCYRQKKETVFTTLKGHKIACKKYNQFDIKKE